MTDAGVSGRAAGGGWRLAAALSFLVVAAAVAYAHFDLGSHLSLEGLKAARGALQARFEQQPVATLAIFFSIYVAAAALSVPGATVLTLAAGAIFGLGIGTLVVSFASAVGATLAFLAARYLLRSWIQRRFRERLDAVDEGIRRDGAWYLLTLRLVPALPFFVVNLLAGLTAFPVGRFYWVSQLGMLPATLVYVNAGTQLAQIRTLSDVLSPTLIGSLLLLATVPLIAKRVLDAVRGRRRDAPWPRPTRFDANLVVIGAGSAGLVTAYIAAAVKAKVVLVEAHEMGGDCLNTGCVPSKALLRSARLAAQARRADAYGLRPAELSGDFAAVMDRVQRVIRTVEPHDSPERYRALGVDVWRGRAKITSPWTVQVDSDEGVRTLTTRSIVIATGASPVVPDIPGLEAVGYFTSETIWGLRELPKRLVVLGGGPIGCELAQAFARLGAHVTQVERGARLMGREDADAAESVRDALQRDGVTVLTGHTALRCEQRGGGKQLVLEADGGERAVEYDALLCAVGRAPRTAGLGLEELGIELGAGQAVATDGALRTRFPNILACGDVVGPYQFTHVAAHQGWYAAVNALFGNFKRFKVDDSVIPWATFTDPEVARVGLSEDEARSKGVPFEATRYGLEELDRAIADEARQGFVKVLTVPGKDRILGVTIVGEHAGDLLAEYVLAMKHGIGLDKILRTIHTYPTMAEANKNVAGVWKLAHAPQRLLAWATRFHAWRRGDRGAPGREQARDAPT